MIVESDPTADLRLRETYRQEQDEQLEQTEPLIFSTPLIVPKPQPRKDQP